MYEKLYSFYSKHSFYKQTFLDAIKNLSQQNLPFLAFLSKNSLITVDKSRFAEISLSVDNMRRPDSLLLKYAMLGKLGASVFDEILNFNNGFYVACCRPKMLSHNKSPLISDTVLNVNFFCNTERYSN